MTIRPREQGQTPAGGGDGTAWALPSSQLEERAIRLDRLSLKFIQSKHPGAFDDAVQKNREEVIFSSRINEDFHQPFGPDHRHTDDNPVGNCNNKWIYSFKDASPAEIDQAFHAFPIITDAPPGGVIKALIKMIREKFLD